MEEVAATPQLIRSDAAKLRQVLVNLIGNAVKYTQRGGVAVRVRLNPLDGAERLLLELEVWDTGVGIAPEDQERIFETFVQAQGAALSTGTGLGLSISRQFVQSLGGSIRVESRLEKGSLFRVELPVGRAEESELAAGDSRTDTVIGLASGQPEYRILIVEDQRESCLLLERLLQNAGFRVRIAENGTEGVEVFRTWRPDLIWMDLWLPGMSGVETARRVRQLDGGTQVKIVALTASALGSERDQVLAAGLDDLIGKPYRRHEVFDCMERMLGVRYTYEKPVPTAAELGAIAPEALSVLPEELCTELERALILLDMDHVTALIKRVAETEPALGGILTKLSDNLAYTTMLHAIEARKDCLIGERK
jgi:CheY-like chemotaxis protein/anti-sigma regulatory factor (Ser/Thr protein kinase)